MDTFGFIFSSKVIIMNDDFWNFLTFKLSFLIQLVYKPLLRKISILAISSGKTTIPQLNNYQKWEPKAVMKISTNKSKKSVNLSFKVYFSWSKRMAKTQVFGCECKKKRRSIFYKPTVYKTGPLRFPFKQTLSKPGRQLWTL